MSGLIPSNIEPDWEEFLKCRSAFLERQAAMIKVRDRLIRAYLPWTYHLANRAHAQLPQRVPRELLHSEAVTGLLRAVELFDGRVQFQTYARAFVIGAISHWVRKELRQATFSLDDLIAAGHDEGE